MDLSSHLLATPEFVIAGITIAPESQHADLVVQLAYTVDDDETRIEYLAASNPELNVWDLISFLWPATDYEDVIAGKVLKMVIAHCAPRDDHPQVPELLPQLVKQKLLAMRTIRPVARTSWMRDDVLLSAFRARPEFAIWGIKIGRADDPADCDLVVGHLLNTLTWTFRISDNETGAPLREGTVMAFHDERAASKLAAETVKQIAKLRPLPASSQGLQASHETVDKGVIETWEVTAVSEDLKRKFPGKMHLFIEDGIITATDLKGATLFSIPGKSLVDFADTKSYYTFGDEIRGSEDDWYGCDAGCVLMFPYGAILATVDQIRVPLHIFEVAWVENNILQVASLKVSKGDYQDFLSNLELLSESQTNDSP